MKKNVKIVLYALIAVIIVIAVISKIGSGSAKPRVGGRGPGKAGVLNISAYLIKDKKLENKVHSSGSVSANEEVELKSEINGKVTHIYFKEGSHVIKGALLVKINDADLQAQLKKQQVNLSLLAERENRSRQLYQKTAISKEEYDVALNALDVLKADIDVTRAQIDKTEIRAPFDGIIGLKNISEGSYVTPATVIAALQDVNPIKIDFAIPEKYSGLIKAGGSFNFTVSGSDKAYTGIVYAIEPKIDPVTRTLPIRGIYQNSKGSILPGSFAEVELILNDIPNAVLVPSNAIVPEIQGQKVFLYKSGKAIEQKVNIGIRTDTDVQVTSGLSIGDTVITTGILQLKQGMRVKISKIK